MSDEQRRWWCRLIFMLGCVLPTGGVVYFGLHLPTTTDWEQRIQAATGLTTRIEAIETPEPGRTILRRVQVIDPEIQLAAPIAQIELMTWGSPKKLVVRQAVEMAGNSIVALADRLQQLSASLSELDSTASRDPWWVEFQQVTLFQGELHSAAQPLVIHNLSLGWKQTDEGQQTIVRFSLPDRSQPDEFVELVLQHSTRPDSAASAGLAKCAWRLDTHQCRVPGWFVAALLPEIPVAGSNCQFSGSLQINQIGSVTQGDLAGSWFNLDLHTLGASLNLPLKAIADAEIAASLRDGQVHQLDCQLQIRNGSVNRLWLEQLAQLIGAELQPAESEPLVLFSRGQVQFQVREGLLHVEPDALQLFSVPGQHLVSQASRPLAGLEDCVRRLASQSQPTEQVTNAMVRLLGKFDLPPVTRQAREPALGNSYH